MDTSGIPTFNAALNWVLTYLDDYENQEGLVKP